VSDEPYVSVVATSRNDDHGGNLLRRMQLFVSGWIEQCRRHRLPAELVLVEWNPPSDRPPLAQALRWPADAGPCRVRIVTVPPEIHRHYRHAEALPLFQMIAKNVGIRRARAPFVLATNIDILFNDELMSYLASRPLQQGRFYRIDRHDAMADVPASEGIVEQLEYCRTHVLRVNGREATFVGGDAAAALDDPDPAHGGVRFGEGFGLERTAAGGPVQSTGSEAVLHLRPPRPGAVLRLLVDAGPNPRRSTLALRFCDPSGAELTRVPFRGLKRVYVALPISPYAEWKIRLSAVPAQSRRWGPPTLHLRVLDWGWATDAELAREALAAPAKPVAVPAGDIYDPESAIALLGGWDERAWDRHGRLFRRIAGRAKFTVYTSVRVPGRLAMDLDSDQPAQLQVRDENGLLLETTVAGPRRLVLPTPPRGQPAVLEIVLPGADSETAAVRVHALRRLGVGPLLRRIGRLARHRIDFLHTNGCGDFTLMHRDHWFRLRGYPEWEAYSMNIDGFLCYAAHADGAMEILLREPKRTYHIEHALGSGWSPKGERLLRQRIRSGGITWITGARVRRLARRMYGQGPLVVNSAAWGLGNELLQETEPSRS
jgi:hypothetical protein